MSGGNRPRATLRPGPVKSGRPRRLAFQRMESKAMTAARNASASQTLSHAAEFDWCAASQAAASAVAPRMTCPQPGTAVKEAERSMVSRMKRRSAAGSGARSGVKRVGDGCAGRWEWRRRWWRGSGMREDRVSGRNSLRQVLCNAKTGSEILGAVEVLPWPRKAWLGCATRQSQYSNLKIKDPTLSQKTREGWGTRRCKEGNERLALILDHSHFGNTLTGTCGRLF